MFLYHIKQLKNFIELQKTYPKSENIFVDNLIETFYPRRPQNLKNLCLYDFVTTSVYIASITMIRYIGHLKMLDLLTTK